MTNNKFFAIVFGKTEKDDQCEYDYMNAELNLGLNNKTNIEFSINTKYDGRSLSSLSYTLNIEETKELAKKLNDFVVVGEKFLTEYSKG